MGNSPPSSRRLPTEEGAAAAAISLHASSSSSRPSRPPLPPPPPVDYDHDNSPIITAGGSAGGGGGGRITTRKDVTTIIKTKTKTEMMTKATKTGEEGISSSSSTCGGGVGRRRDDGGRDRRPPSRYVARPSRSGYGVDEGDAAFLSSMGGKKKKKKNDDMMTKEGRPLPDSDSAAAAAVVLVATTTTTTTTKASSSSLSANGADGGRSPPPNDDAKAASSSSSSSFSSSWECHRCGLKNDPAKRRCSSCQGWKGGSREGYFHSRTYAAAKRRKRMMEDEEEEEGTVVVGGNANNDPGKNVDRRRRRHSRRAESSTSSSKKNVTTKKRGDVGAATNATIAIESPPPSRRGGKQQQQQQQQQHRRRSAISRRPRRLVPTEKAMAMMMTAATKANSTTATRRRRRTNEGGMESSTAAAAADGRSRSRRRSTSASAMAAGKKTASGDRKTGNNVASVAASGWGVNDDTNVVEGDNGGNDDDANENEACAIVFDRDDDDDDDDDGSNEYDDVACCLCKCAADFSDKDFFIAAPPTTDGGELSIENSMDRSRDKNAKKDDKDSTPQRDDEKDDVGNDDDAENVDDDGHPVRLPYRFHDPGNALMLCDGPAHAKSRKRGNIGQNLSDEEYRCDRAYHQRCHFVPVLSIPRGPWRCLICRFRDEVYLNEKASRKANDGSSGKYGECVTLSDSELNAIFRCVPVHPAISSKDEKWSAANWDKTEVVSRSDEEGLAENCKTIPNVESSMNSDVVGIVQCNKQSAQCHGIFSDKGNNDHDIAKLERRFEDLSAHLKSQLLHTELTSRSRGIIKSSLSTIRTAEHSLRSITETSKARKALAERIESQLGLPQELCQCVMRIAASKTRVRELILNLENVIRSRPLRHDPPNVVQLLTCSKRSSAEDDDEKAHAIITGNAIDGGECISDPVSELMQWYLQQGGSAQVVGKDLLHHLFPEGTIKRRRYEPRTGEAHINAEAGVGDESSVTSISLDDLTCWNCHGTHATDENDMVLCDGMGCYRSFHMKCLEPQLTFEEIHKNIPGEEDDAWFCPLCTANANLTHFAQIEYLGDDWESPSKKSKIGDGKSNGNNGQRMKEWETAMDVFPEAPFELRVAQKLKENTRDEETTTFLAQSLGIFTGSSHKDDDSDVSSANQLLLAEEDESDDDFDHEEVESLDDESFAEDRDMERQLVKEKIGREELDALSVTSGDGSDSDLGNSSSAGMDDSSIDARNHRPRRSKRKRFTFSKKAGNGDDDTLSETQVAMPSSDVGTVDVANIVPGKRRRTQVDYRKLADVMFGDESDEEAKGAKREYTFKPKARGRRKDSDDVDDNDEDDSSESDNDSDC